MANKKKTKKRTKTPSTAPSKWRLVWKFLFGTLTIAGIVGLGGLAGSVLSEHAKASAGLAHAPIDIEMTPAPAWLLKGKLTKDSLPKILDRPIQMADPSLVNDLALGLEKSPWIDNVSIHRDFRSLKIDLTYRTPVLVLPWKQYGCYMDAQARVVPAQDADASILKKCLIIEGVQIENLPKVGQIFNQDVIQQAAKLAEFLQPKHDKFSLLAMVVTTTPKQPTTCYFKTRRGSRIIWGPLANSADQNWQEKARRLETLSEPFGTLEPPHGPMEFDVSRKILGRPVRLFD